MTKDQKEILLINLRSARNVAAADGKHETAHRLNAYIKRLKEEDMHEYWITLTFQVRAQDIEDAGEIAKDLLGAATKGTIYKVDGEVSQIEEVD